MDTLSNNPNSTPPHNEKTPEQQQADKFKALHRHEYRRFHDRWFGNLFFGALLIIIGIAFLARSLGYVPDLNIGQFFVHIWPVFVIMAGLSVMADGGAAARVISAILMLLILAIFVLWLFRIPVHGKIGARSYNFDPAVMDGWLSSHK